VAWKILARFEYQVQSFVGSSNLLFEIPYTSRFRIRTVAWLDFDPHNFQLIVDPLHKRVCGEIHAGALQLKR
jgi:hypothetical protein